MRCYTKERAEHNARVAERTHEMITMIGEVFYDLHPSATYVRVSIPQHSGISLALKVTRGDFDRYLFKKGRIVEVQESCKRDHRRFIITRVFDEAKVPVNVSFKITVPNADALVKEKTVEKVKFYLNSKYFENPELLGVLGRVFNMTHEEYRVTFNQGTGLTFICTTDQFARFLIDRNLNGIKNGFMDLNAKLIHSEPKPDAYAILAKEVGITREQAKLVSLAMGYKTEGAFRSRVSYGESGSDRMHRKLDVSER